MPLLGLTLAEVRPWSRACRPGTKPSPDLTQQLWRRSGGNPFFVG